MQPTTTGLLRKINRLPQGAARQRRVPLLKSRPLADPDISDRMTATENSVQRMTVMEQPFPMSGPGRIRVPI